MAYDILIKNARIVDGSGKPAFNGNVAVHDGRIAGVGKVDGSAKQVIDAQGMTVTPGFLDVHTHYDAQLMWDPYATSSTWHGVTTVVTGNCGFTLAPCKPRDREYMLTMLARVEGMDEGVLRSALQWEWEGFGEFLARLQRRLGINVACFVGHSATRRYVMGEESTKRAADDDEVQQMKALLKKSLDEGGFGFSTSGSSTHWGADGLPVPSRLATREEFVELASALAGRRAGFMELAGGQGLINKYSPEGKKLLLDMSLAAGRPLNWNDVTYVPDRPTAWKDLLDTVAAQRAQGAKNFLLGRCQTAGFEFNLLMTNIFDRYEHWAHTLIQPHAEKKRLLGDPQVRRQLQEDLDEHALKFKRGLDWNRVMVMKAALPKNAQYDGKRVPEIAKQQGKANIDAFFDLGLEEDLKTQFHLLDERNSDETVVRQILNAPLVMGGTSDAGAHCITECSTGFTTHLLGYWSRERKLIAFEEAVKRITSLPAAAIGLVDRGLVQEGKVADLVLLEPEKVKDLPKEFVNDFPGNAKRLVQRSEGVHKVLVNGQVIWEDGHHTGALPGKVLKSTDY